MKAKRSGGYAVSGRIFLFQSVFSPKTFSLSRLYNERRRQRKQATDLRFVAENKFNFVMN
ncbi:conserved domain protein [Bacteroides fluxus YIT 12057]|uniref:Conserved domain protein n=1 Tax=Bacteroides fluxus YIT 12057 TaxID=763034 RepID=F3PUU7_9BACE|nr:conserved domain protein [Bacteroides fluxus YIT 12057]